MEWVWLPFVDLRFFRQLSAIRLRGFAPLSSIPLWMVGQPQLISSDRDYHINRNCSRLCRDGGNDSNGGVNDRYRQSHRGSSNAVLYIFRRHTNPYT